MPLASYNPGNPAATDAWNIESTLAPLAVGGSQSEAQQMLDMYRNERLAQSNVYGQNLAQEHQFAYDQLRQQMQEAYLKAIPEMNKAGTLGIMASSPLYSAGLAGADPSVVADTIQRQQQAEDAKTFQAGMTGLNQGSQGGYQVANPNAVIPGLPPNVQLTNKGPALAQAATIRGQYGLAAANARGAKPQLTTVSNQSAPDAYGNVTSTSTRVPVDQVEAEQQRIAERNQRIRDRRAGGGDGSGGGSGSTLKPNPAANKPATTAQPANTSAQPTPVKLDTNSRVGSMAQGAATIAIDRATQDGKTNPNAARMAADVKAGMDGTVYNTHATSDGKLWVKGASGHFYPIQN